MRKDSIFPLSPTEVLMGARLFLRLSSFLPSPVSLEKARAMLHRRLERRELEFLDLARRAIYQAAGSPYRQLLDVAGCEYGDLEQLVWREGVEGALRMLFRHGVYLTVDELKGRTPAHRGSSTIHVDPERLLNPLAARHVPVQSSGSRGKRTPLAMDIRYLRDLAANVGLALDAAGGIGWDHALWGVPGGAAILQILQYSGCGCHPVRWFSQVDPVGAGLHPRYRWSSRVLRWGSLLAGHPLPRPEYVPLENPLPIARWMSGVLRDGGVPHLHTFATSAVRLCQAASEEGVDLRGARFSVGGEPVTRARLAVVRGAGAEAWPRYASIEVGTIGRACLAPEEPDEVHVFHDHLALLQPGPDGKVRGLPAKGLFLSSLHPRSPLLLLNVSLGDQAVLTQRKCGCPLERLGWIAHLHTIRSFEKLTAGGMKFLDAVVIPVLEEVLPARFGGGPTDYQLVEEEAGDGRPVLRLLVHPAVGPIDGGAVAEAFLLAIASGSGSERVMASAWREAGLLRVERRAPLTTVTGKMLHLHSGLAGLREGPKTRSSSANA